MDFKAPNVRDHAVLTSPQAVHSFVRKNNGKLVIKNCFCVGNKTKALLEKNGLKVKEFGQNAAQLSQKLVKNYKKQVFYYLGGPIRRHELPNALQCENMTSFEIKADNTVLIAKRFDQKWDGIMFFRPSGVASYISEHKHHSNVPAFCIGQTTASDAKKYFKNVVVADTNTIESVLEKTIEAL